MSVYAIYAQQDPLVLSSKTSGVINTGVAFGRTVVPVPMRNKPLKKDTLGFEYAEHSFIGDAINLTLVDDEKVPAIDHKFTLNNGLTVTYGQINGLSGDFYGTTNPISDGKDLQDQRNRFLAAFNTLAELSSRQPEEARDILAILQAEVDAVNDALHRREDPSIVYNNLPDVSYALEALTITRPAGFPSYLGLALINWDHFGQDARTSYNAGHALALETAANGDLDMAYVLNAFADHFLEDSFSAGHLRTPRRGLHREAPNYFADYCAKLMHDEDCAIGLTVTNTVGQSWMCYGDKRALDDVAAENLELCTAAVQASADEVYSAYKAKTVPLPNNYKAWTIAPTLESACGPQELGSLFKYKDATQSDVERRMNIENRRVHDLTIDWWFFSTALECKLSGWWNYPITINGPPKVVPWTNFAATAPRTGSARLFYQNPSHGVMESTHLDGTWSSGVQEASIWIAAPFTPLAAISWDNGNEIRVYYLNAEYKLSEFCYHNNTWGPGDLDKLNIQAACDTSIAAFKYTTSNDLHIRVYCQEESSSSIMEFCNDGSWFKGAILPVALKGTSIAAIAYQFDGLQFRVYYQGEDLSIREHCHGPQGWFAGPLLTEKAPGRCQIGALHKTWPDDIRLDVYWLNVHSEIVRSVNTEGVWTTSKVVGPLQRGTKFAPLEWENGKYIRVYYQVGNNSIVEVCKDEDGDWFAGATVAVA